MSDKYTPEEIKEFKERDRRIVCQNALQHATATAIAQGTPNTKAITAIASDLVDWVFTKAAEQPKPPVAKQRSPNPEESRLLAMLLKKYDDKKPEGTVADFLKLQKAVWSRYGKYPTKEGSIDKLFVEIPAAEVLSKNDFVPESK